MFIELTILIITLCIVLDYLRKKERNALTANLPGPKEYPIFGSAFAMIKRNSNNILEHSIESHKLYGTLYKVWLFNRLVIFCSEPKYLEIIMSSPKYINKGKLYDLLRIWLGDGLLVSSGSKWHSRRKIITPTFHFKILEQFVEIFDQQTSILVDKLQSKCNDTNGFNIQPFICLAALDIITESAMGTKVHAQTESENEYANAVTEILHVMSERFVNVWLRFEFIFAIFRSDLKKRQTNALKILHNFTDTIIQKRRQALEESIANGTYKQYVYDDDQEIGRKRRMALLDVLLQANINGQPLSNQDIREEVDTFMFEGHDTTTSGISSALHCISRHPEIQQKLFAEIREVLGDDKDRSITLRELQDLKYMDCVIRETLRMYPVVPSFGRHINEQIQLGDGKVLPAGSSVTIIIYSMQRDEKLFANPNTFNPDRYLTENFNKDQATAFSDIPFSAGPRNCIGQKYAMLEMKSTISKILRHYELLPAGPDKMELKVNLVMKQINGVHVALKKRMY